MGINYNKKIPLTPQTNHCKDCNIDYPEDFVFCPNCGKKLTKKKSDVYANIGKNGISSISVKKGQMTINSKGNITIPLAKGISYTTKIKDNKG